MPRITPNLWFDTESMEAAEFYVSVFPNSKITNVTYYNEAGPRPAGTVLTVDFELDGQDYTAINGGPAVHVRRGDLAARSTAPTRTRSTTTGTSSSEGGEEGQCGWLKDKFGLSWQVVPEGMEKMSERPRPGTRPAGHEGDARHEEARHRRPRSRRRPGVATPDSTGPCPALRVTRHVQIRRHRATRGTGWAGRGAAARLTRWPRRYRERSWGRTTAAAERSSRSPSPWWRGASPASSPSRSTWAGWPLRPTARRSVPWSWSRRCW